MLPFLLAYTAFLIFPVLLGLRMSFYNASLVGTDSQFLGLANYRELFGDPDFWISLWHTILFTLLSTPPLVLLSLVFALLANRAIPARWFFRARVLRAVAPALYHSSPYLGLAVPARFRAHKQLPRRAGAARGRVAS